MITLPPAALALLPGVVESVTLTLDITSGLTDGPVTHIRTYLVRTCTPGGEILHTSLANELRYGGGEETVDEWRVN